ncbi:MAG TPA: hypothetical protein VF885_24830 [Arthrobacter sp.]
MTSTLQTTLVQLLGQTIEQCVDPDPNNDLELSEEEHADLYQRALVLYEREADKILDPYGCTLLGNGEIIRRDVMEDVPIFDAEDIKEKLGMIDVSEVLPQDETCHICGESKTLHQDPAGGAMLCDDCQKLVDMGPEWISNAIRYLREYEERKPK